MTKTFIIALTIYLVGVMVAWLQIWYWNRKNDIVFPKDYKSITLISLLSWVIYPVWFVEWTNDNIEM